jgi:hypothetical protein
MRSWLAILLALVGGAGIVGSGCGRSAGVRAKDAAGPLDAAIPSGGSLGLGGVVGTGGVPGAGGLTTAGRFGSAVGTGGLAAVGGASGLPAGSYGTAGAGVAGATSSGGAGAAGGSGRADASVPDVPGGKASGTGGASGGGATGSGGGPNLGGGPGTGGVPGMGGAAGTGTGTSIGGSSGAGGATVTGGSTGSGGSTAPGSGPCDIYAAASPATPCVAAYSMVRVLASTYRGPLYQVRQAGSNRGTGGTTQDVGAVDGFADAAIQDSFCGSSACTVSILYDQSGQGNDLTVAKRGCYSGTASEDDFESNAKGRSLTLAGRKVYALSMKAHDGYRNNQTKGMPTGSAAQGIYEVADGRHAGNACCWDFGNARTDNCYGASGSMNALYFGTDYWTTGTGTGPWFFGDSGSALWPSDTGSCVEGSCLNNPSMFVEFAFGVLKTSQSNGAIRVGNAQGGALTTAYDGSVAFTWQMQGAIVLGIGTDNSNSSYGTFFEGAITAGRPSDVTDEAVLKNVQAAGYGM